VRKQCAAEKATKLRATIPFDVWLMQSYKESEGRLYNCKAPSDGGDSALFEKKMNDYADVVGLREIIAALTPQLKSFIGKCQINTCLDEGMYGDIERVLPPLRNPLTVYRVYINGYTAPEINTFQTLRPFTSFSLSQSYPQFFKDSRYANVFVRCDCMPGIHILPALEYHGGADSAATELEILVNGKYQVHALDPKLVPEGRGEADAAPIYYGVNPQKFDKYSQISAFFVLSVPGSCFEYYPEFNADGHILVGGRKKIILNDQNKIGVGDANNIIKNYLTKMKKNRSEAKRSRVQRPLNQPKFKRFSTNLGKKRTRKR
jgi:hypothetical protein